MLKPYATKLENIKSEITQIGVDVCRCYGIIFKSIRR